MYFILWISKWQNAILKGSSATQNLSIKCNILADNGLWLENRSFSHIKFTFSTKVIIHSHKWSFMSFNLQMPRVPITGFFRQICQNTNLGFWEHLLQHLLPERFFNSCGLVSHPHPNCEKFAKFEIVLIMKACVHSYFVCRYKGFVLLFGLKICTDRGLICVTIWPEEMCSAVSWS